MTPERVSSMTSICFSRTEFLRGAPLPPSPPLPPASLKRIPLSEPTIYIAIRGHILGSLFKVESAESFLGISSIVLDGIQVFNIALNALLRSEGSHKTLASHPKSENTPQMRSREKTPHNVSAGTNPVHALRRWASLASERHSKSHGEWLHSRWPPLNGEFSRRQEQARLDATPQRRETSAPWHSNKSREKTERLISSGKRYHLYAVYSQISFIWMPVIWRSRWLGRAEWSRQNSHRT